MESSIAVMRIGLYASNKYLFILERESAQGEGQREETESQADSLLSVELDLELHPPTLTS